MVEFEPRQVIADAIPSHCPRESEDFWSRLRLQHRTLTSGAAALAALALHVGFVAPVLWGGGAFPHRQERSYRGDTALQWIVLEESSSSSATGSRRPPLSPTLMAIRLTGVAPALPPSILPAEAMSGSAQSDSHSGLGTMYGRYLGQIHARIDRAWLRPRTAVGAPIFQCQVQLDQDGLGRIQGVTLLQCNGSASWRLSLVHTIEAASPLPAPPTRAVFAPHVLMAFRAIAYSSGAPAELYEPPSVARVNDAPDERDNLSQNAFQALREAAQAQKPRAFALRIEGSKVEVEPDRQ